MDPIRGRSKSSDVRRDFLGSQRDNCPRLVEEGKGLQGKTPRRNKLGQGRKGRLVQ